MEYKRNQNSYEELQTIVEAQQERIETLLTKLCRIRVLVLDDELFNEAMKDASERGEEKTEFKLDQNEIYSLEGATEEQKEKLLTWLKNNDIGWDVLKYIEPFHRGIRYNVKEWIFCWDIKSTKYIKDLI